MGKISINLFSYLKLSIVLLILVFSANLVSAEALPNAKIAIVFSTGGLGDQSFNDAANKGLLEAKEANPGITSSQVEPTDVAGITSAIHSFAADGSYDLIIGIGFTATDGITVSAKAHPAQNFMIVDSVISLPNVVSIVFAEHEGSFLAGAMAAMVSETNDIAFLGGLDIPLINKFFAGYYEGARYINPEIIVRKAYSPNPSNPWGDLAGGKAVGLNFIEQGSDIIYAAAGGTGLGVMDAAEEASTADNKIYAIGVDTNQDHLKEGFVLTSMIKRIDVAVVSQIQAVVDGTWVAGFTELDLAAEGVGITDMEFTQIEANAEFEMGITRLEKLDELTQMIIDREIVVNRAISDFVTYPIADVVPPSITSPVDMEYFLSDTGNNLKWLVEDAYPDIFNVYKNGSLYQPDSRWYNGSINVGVDGFDIGVYELTIYIYDKFNNMNSDTVLVTVKEVSATSDQTTSTDDEPTLDFLDYPNLMIPLSFLVAIVIFRKKKNSKSIN